MFICEVTGKISQPGEKLNRITVKTRERSYLRKEKDMESGEWHEVQVSQGWEIVKQISATEEGAQKWSSMTEQQKDTFLKNNNIIK